ncbi:hypothetical protein HK096_005679, partial [Nowakowskiella sp. JEL0078]
MDAEQQQTPEEIRAKRLASLAKVQQLQQPSPATPKPPKPEGSPQSSQQNTPKPLRSSAIAMTPANIAMSSSSSSSSTSSVNTSNTPTRSPSSALKPALTFLAIEDATWLHKNIEAILQVSLNQLTPSPSIFLAALREELAEEANGGSLPQLSDKPMVDRALSARLMLHDNARPDALPLFDYLVQTWQRCVTVSRSVDSLVAKVAMLGDADTKARVDAAADVRGKVLTEVRELVVNYAGLVLMVDMADFYPQAPSVTALGPSYLAQKLLQNVSDLPREFLGEFIQRYENEDFEQFLIPILNSIATAMRGTNVTKDYQTPLN